MLNTTVQCEIKFYTMHLTFSALLTLHLLLVQEVWGWGVQYRPPTPPPAVAAWKVFPRLESHPGSTRHAPASTATAITVPNPELVLDLQSHPELLAW